jgi:hypothetical protein
MVSENPSSPHGHGFRFDGGGKLELDVENVSCTGVPVGGVPGVTGFGLNAQVDFAGAPTQLNVKVKPDPAEANATRVIGILCPATTVGELDVTASDADTTVWTNAIEVLEVNIESPP